MAFIGTLNTMAQKIAGKIVDTTLTPIASATIVLQTVDSTFVEAVVSKEDGTFSFSKNTIPFILTIQHINYKTFQQTFHNGNVGMIKMTSAEQFLNEVVVSAKKLMQKWRMVNLSMM